MELRSVGIVYLIDWFCFYYWKILKGQIGDVKSWSVLRHPGCKLHLLAVNQQNMSQFLLRNSCSFQKYYAVPRLKSLHISGLEHYRILHFVHAFWFSTAWALYFRYVECNAATLNIFSLYYWFSWKKCYWNLSIKIICHIYTLVKKELGWGNLSFKMFNAIFYVLNLTVFCSFIKYLSVYSRKCKAI